MQAYSVSVRDAVEAAPPLYDVLAAIDAWTPQRLREAWHRDAEAEAFTEDGLQQILNAARTHDRGLALGLARRRHVSPDRRWARTHLWWPDTNIIARPRAGEGLWRHCH